MRRNKIIPNDESSLNENSAYNLKNKLDIIPKPLTNQGNKKPDFSNIDIGCTTSVKKIQEEKYCRICLQLGKQRVLNSQGQPETSDQNELINACRCQGSVGYIHNRCMIKWIQSQFNHHPLKTINCEICLAKIHYKTGINRYFDFTMEKFVNRVRIYHLIIAVVILITITILGAFMILKDQFEIQISTLPMIIMGITQLFLFLCLMVVISLIIRDCFLQRFRRIQYIYAYQEWQKHLQMHPSLRQIISIRSTIQSRRTIGQSVA